jgi:hypothetical protein
MKALLASLALLPAECDNISYHVDDHDRAPDGVYRGTRDGSNAVVELFVVPTEWRSWFYSEVMDAHCISLLSSPVFLVDWPLDVVADTVTFPYDLYKEITK